MTLTRSIKLVKKRKKVGKGKKGKDAVWPLDVNKIDWQDKFTSAPSAVKAIKLRGSREREGQAERARNT